MGRSTAFVDPPAQPTARQRLQERVAAMDRAGLHSEWIVHVRACKIKSCSDSCTRQKRSLAHVKKCRQATCDYDGMCQVTKEVLNHYKSCDKPKEQCKICVHLLKSKPPAAAPVVQQPEAVQQVPQAPAVVAPPAPEQPPEASSSAESTMTKKKKKKKSPVVTPSTSADSLLDPRFDHNAPVGWRIPSSKGAVCPPTPPESPASGSPQAAPQVVPHTPMALFEAFFASTLRAAAASPQASTALRDMVTAAVGTGRGWLPAAATPAYLPTLNDHTRTILQASACPPRPPAPPVSPALLGLPTVTTGALSSSSTVPESEMLLQPQPPTTYMSEEQRARFRQMQEEAKLSPAPAWINPEDREKFLQMDFSPSGTPAAIVAAPSPDVAPAAVADPAYASFAAATAIAVEYDGAAAAAAGSAAPADTEQIFESFSEACELAMLEEIMQTPMPQRPLPSNEGANGAETAADAADDGAATPPEDLTAAQSALHDTIDIFPLVCGLVAHARDCNAPCKFSLCGNTKIVFVHMSGCFEKDVCKFPNCGATRKILWHWALCKRPENCTACAQIRRRGKPAEHYYSIDPQLMNVVSMFSLSAQLMDICKPDNDAISAAERAKTHKLVDEFIFPKKNGKLSPEDDLTNQVRNMIVQIASLTNDEKMEMQRRLNTLSAQVALANQIKKGLEAAKPQPSVSEAASTAGAAAAK